MMKIHTNPKAYILPCVEIILATSYFRVCRMVADENPIDLGFGTTALSLLNIISRKGNNKAMENTLNITLNSTQPKYFNMPFL